MVSSYAPMANKTATKRKSSKPAPKAKSKPKAKKKSGRGTPPGDQLLREELTAARHELKSLAHADNILRRELEATLSNERNATDRLRAELGAVRLDLKTALAELEIARADAQRESARALAQGREMTAAMEAQRLAEHASTSTREQLYELRRENDRLRGELKRPA